MSGNVFFIHQGTLVSVDFNDYNDVPYIIDGMMRLGAELYNPGKVAVPRSQPLPVKGQRLNRPADFIPCPHHPEGTMRPDKQNPGQYYCHNKLSDDKWCGFKSDSQKVIKLSRLDAAVQASFTEDEIPF